MANGNLYPFSPPVPQMNRAEHWKLKLEIQMSPADRRKEIGYETLSALSVVRQFETDQAFREERLWLIRVRV